MSDKLICSPVSTECQIDTSDHYLLTVTLSVSPEMEQAPPRTVWLYQYCYTSMVIPVWLLVSFRKDMGKWGERNCQSPCAQEDMCIPKEDCVLAKESKKILQKLHIEKANG